MEPADVPGVAERRRGRRTRRWRPARSCSPTWPASPATVTTPQGRGPMLTKRCSASRSSCRTAQTVDRRRGVPPRVDRATRRPRSSAGFQPLMPTFQGLVTRRAAAAADRVRQVAEQPGRRAAPARHQRRAAGCRRAATAGGRTTYGNPELPEQRPRPGVVAADEGPQAHRAAVSRRRSPSSSSSAGSSRCMIRLELLTPAGDLMSAETYNKMFTMHGVVMVFFFLIPSIPAVLGNFLIPIMIGAKDLAFPRINLLSWYIYVLGGHLHARRGAERRRRHRLDVLHALQHGASNSHVITAGARRLHHRLLVDPDRPELHRHDPPDARARADLVPPAALRVGALRDQPDHDPRHAGHRDHGAAGGGRARAAPRDLRSGARRRPGALPAPVLVLLAPGGLHHDPAGDGGHQRDRRRRSRARTSSATRSSRSRRWRSRSSASWCGATTCSSPASRSTPGWSSRS